MRLAITFVALVLPRTYTLALIGTHHRVRHRLQHHAQMNVPDSLSDAVLRRAWLNSLKSDSRESDLAARLNNRSRYYDPALRYVYESLSNAQRGQLHAISKAPRPQRGRSRRKKPREAADSSRPSDTSEEFSVSISPRGKQFGGEQPLTPRTYAVLVDAENANWRTMKAIMAQLSRYGDARIRRMYGDFSVAQLAPWAEVERNHSFMMVHQGALVKGKGCSDILLAADAMEIR